jgi:hypothetical protein
VSSLRSHFENMLSNASKPSTPRHPSPLSAPSPAAVDRLAQDRRNDGRMSLDIPRQHTGRASSPSVADYSGNGSVTPRGGSLRTPWTTPKPRPTSMVAFTPPSPTRSPPKLAVISPKSPPRTSEPQIYEPLPSRTLGHSTLNSPAASPSGDPRKSGTFERPLGSAPPVPPPINRAGKPKMLTKAPSMEPPARMSLAPDHDAEGHDRVSPFSTPPSSHEGSPAKEGSGARDGYFPPPPLHHSVAEKISSSDPRTIVATSSSKMATPPPPRSPMTNDRPEDRPALPVRRERDNFDLRRSMVIQRAVPPEPPVRRSMDMSRPSTINHRMPPPRRESTANIMSGRSLEPPKPPPPRNSGEFRRSGETLRPALTSAPAQQPYSYDSDDTDTANEKSGPALADYPDSSQANRRPPIFENSTNMIPTGYETKLFAICGEYICTTGYVTNVWNVLNGRLLVSLSHGDTVKATSVAFRPAKDVEDEGKRLWLGTNIGEMHEVDIPTQSIVFTKTNAHRGAPVIKIFRYASEMWSLDDEGTLHIWPPDELGHPTLQQTPCTFRIPRGQTFSIISGSQLWLAYTKDIRVYNRTGDNDYFEQLTKNSISQSSAGDVTSGAILSSQPDRIYFGHTDGKVTIYSKKSFECLGVVNVSLYKISSLVGVGDNLWAGYSTGMIYVYDISTTPWKVLKDWKAHEKKPIAGILADRTSIWKLDRLQVASLGTDNLLRIWDGMLKDDWLGWLMNCFWRLEAYYNRNSNAATRFRLL